MFSRLPEADQQAILRQANKDEFERYITHAHQKLRGRNGPASRWRHELSARTKTGDGSANPTTGNTASITAADTSAATSTGVAAGTAPTFNDLRLR
jgi:hypothetical protein